MRFFRPTETNPHQHWLDRFLAKKSYPVQVTQTTTGPWSSWPKLPGLIRFGVTLLLVVVGALSVYLHVYHNSLMNWICHEDGLLENSQALLFFVAAVLFSAAAVRAGRAGFFLWGLALLSLFAAGEEISWGQRLFKIDTPEWLDRINVQHELTVHNIEGLQGNHRWMGLVFLSGSCFLVPLCDALLAPCSRLFRRLRVPIFPLWAIGIWAMAVLFMAVSRWVSGTVVFNMDEMGEFYVAVALLVWGLAEVRTAP